MKKLLLLILLVVVAGGLVALWFVSRGVGRGVGRPGPAAAATATPLPPARITQEVVAEARVVPVQSAELSLPIGGIVAEILVQEGDRVQAGQVLLRLNSSRQRANLAQMEAQLRRAQARYEQVAAGSRPQEIMAAKASVDAAQAYLEKLKQGPRPEDVEAAQAALAAAQAELRKAAAGPDQQQLIAAKAELDNAEAARRQAQAAYDRVAGSPDIGSRPESLALERATNEYNAAKARYEALLKGPDPATVAAARAKVNQAQAELNRVQAPADPADIAAAEAEVRRAQAQLDLLLAGPRAEEIAAALAEVSAAEAAVDEARAALLETELTAPFDGEVVSLDVILGQQVAAGQRLVRLADFSDWRIETNDLTELDVVGILPGDPVVVTFDAIPDLTLPGTVLRIKPIGENRQGDITYTVIVGLERSDERLLWNMTATVRIERGMAAQQGQAVAAASVPTATQQLAPPPPEALPTATPTFTAVSTPTPTLAPSPVTETPPPAGSAAITATLPAVATATPEATPTATDTPTAAPTVTDTPTPTLTLRPAAAATRPARPTPRPTPTSRVSATPPELVSPSDGEPVSGSVFFRWRPTSTLPVNAAYEVVWWNVNENPAAARGLAPPTTLTSLSVNLDVLYEGGQFVNNRIFWTVLVVQPSPYVRLTQPGQGPVGSVVYQPASGPAGGEATPTEPPPENPRP